MFVCLTTSGGVALKDAALFCFGVVGVGWDTL